MAIFDIHTHAPRHRDGAEETQENPSDAMYRPDKHASTAHTWESYMDALSNVDRAVVFNIAADPRDDRNNSNLQYPVPDVNDDTAAIVHAYPEKLIGFLTVHPHDPEAMDEIDRCTGDLELKGIKLGPNYQNFDPLGEEAFRVFKRAEELELPILLHQGTSPVQFADLDYAHPRHIDRIAMAFPNLRMVLAHMGHPWQIDCIVVIRKHPNVYADISAQFYRPWSCYNAFTLAQEWGVMHKLLFGSDLPIATPDETIEGTRHVNDVIAGTGLPRIDEEALEAIIHRDSLSLLGLA
jgi:uncharacterized protein